MSTTLVFCFIFLSSTVLSFFLLQFQLVGDGCEVGYDDL